MADASVGVRRWSLTLDVPVVAEGNEDGWDAYVDLNGGTRLLVKGKNYGEAMKALREKLEDHLNELFW